MILKTTETNKQANKHKNQQQQKCRASPNALLLCLVTMHRWEGVQLSIELFRCHLITRSTCIFVTYSPTMGNCSGRYFYFEIFSQPREPSNVFISSQPQESIYHKHYLDSIWTINTNICIATTINTLCDRQAPKYIYFSVQNKNLKQHTR